MLKRKKNPQNYQPNQNWFVIICRNAQGNSKGWVCAGVCVVSQIRICTPTIYVLEDFCKICYSLTGLYMQKQTIYYTHAYANENK